MKRTYTISVSGWGAEVYCHKLTQEQRNQLNELAADGIIKNTDDATDIIGAEDLFMEDGEEAFFYGADGDEFTIIVSECARIDFYNDAKILHEISDVEFIDSKFAFQDDYLFAVNRVKGTFGIFELNLESEIDITKIAIERIDINSQINLVNNIFYYGEKLMEFDGLDTSSHSLSLILKKHRLDKKVAKTTSKKKTAGKTSMKTKGSSRSSLSEIVEIKIGSQIWMSTNINVDRFRNGDLIPEVKTDKEWKKVGNDKQPAWCYYQNKLANGTIYGKLYNWHAINDPRGLAPEGFHIPTTAEWKVLSDYLGGHKIAGGKMKSTGTQYWKSPSPDEDLSDIEVTNESGFSGLPGGKRSDYGVFDYVGIEGNWWSSTESNKKIAISLTESISPAEHFQLYNSLSQFGYCEGTKGSGFSIRCLRD